MPVEIDVSDEDGCLPLSDFVSYIEGVELDFSRSDDVLIGARALKKLANNRSFLLEEMFAELGALSEFQSANHYLPQVFVLHSSDRYAVRANVWKPLAPIQRSIPGFRYDICHDHNFHILTVGYFGPGYQSRVYTYQAGDVVGQLGEEVHLRPEGLFTLSEGKVALYRAKEDVHIQLPPEKLSISLNLIPKDRNQYQPQCQFDEQTGRICRYLQISGSEFIVRLSGFLGAEDSLDLLNRVSKTHSSLMVRALAKVAHAQLASGSDRAYDETVGTKESPLLRDIVKRELKEYGACLRLYSELEGSGVREGQ